MMKIEEKKPIELDKIPHKVLHILFEGRILIKRRKWRIGSKIHLH